MLSVVLPALVLVGAVGLSGCGEKEGSAGARGGAKAAAGRSGGGGPGEKRPDARPGGGKPRSAAVPVETARVERRTISSFIETNGTLEAENEVDLVARIAGPIVELKVEEGDAVAKGQLLARIDDEELRAQIEIARVGLVEARIANERVRKLQDSQLVSSEEFEQAMTRFETARAQLEGTSVLLSYTAIKAPFAGLIVNRYVNFAQQVSVNTPLFRLSDFTPLLCPIQIPERDLRKVRVGQSAYLTFEAWPEERFEANVLRISPVVDAGTGTVKVTLDVDARGSLRPGMFARVFVETETREDALAIPRTALSLDSLGDTVYVVESNAASRRDIELGFREGDLVEVLSGLEEGEQIVVVGQDGLSDRTPVHILEPKTR